MQPFKLTIYIDAESQEAADDAVTALYQTGETLKEWPEDAQMFGCDHAELDTDPAMTKAGK